MIPFTTFLPSFATNDTLPSDTHNQAQGMDFCRDGVDEAMRFVGAKAQSDFALPHALPARDRALCNHCCQGYQEQALVHTLERVGDYHMENDVHRGLGEEIVRFEVDLEKDARGGVAEEGMSSCIREAGRGDAGADEDGVRPCQIKCDRPHDLSSTAF